MRATSGLLFSLAEVKTPRRIGPIWQQNRASSRRRRKPNSGSVTCNVMSCTVNGEFHFESKLQSFPADKSVVIPHLGSVVLPPRYYCGSPVIQREGRDFRSFMNVSEHEWSFIQVCQLPPRALLSVQCPDRSCPATLS